MARNKNALPVIVLTVVVIGGVALYAYEASRQPAHTSTLGAATHASPAVSAIPELPGANCHMRGLLPDPSCTPGATDPTVTQQNIHQTICVSGYTKTVRPSVTYTNHLKTEQMQEYGFTDSLHQHEEDHLISLELGGSPTDPHNLWPEPGNSPNPKDKVENFLHMAVCAGRLSLQAAQVRIATNWTTAENGL